MIILYIINSFTAISVSSYTFCFVGLITVLFRSHNQHKKRTGVISLFIRSTLSAMPIENRRFAHYQKHIHQFYCFWRFKLHNLFDSTMKIIGTSKLGFKLSIKNDFILQGIKKRLLQEANAMLQEFCPDTLTLDTQSSDSFFAPALPLNSLVGVAYIDIVNSY